VINLDKYIILIYTKFMSMVATKSPKRQSTKKSTSPRISRNSTVSKWGNSLGLRIPQDAVDRLELRAGDAVTLEVNNDSITIRPTRRSKRWTLDKLLDGVKQKKIGEWPWGKPVGREVW
jgi:antitoxin MazE